MSKIMSMIEEKIMPIAEKVAENKYLLAIRDGFMLTMPLLIIGAISLLFAYLPIPGYEGFMAGLFGEDWSSFFTSISRSSMSVMTIFVIFGISNSLSLKYKIEGISTAAISLVSFFILTPFLTSFTPEGAQAAVSVGGVIPVEWIGAKGLFVGMIVAVLATESVRFITNKGWIIKMPQGVPPTVAKSFASLIPAALTMLMFTVIRLFFTLTSFETIHNFVYTILQVPLTSLLGDSLGGVLASNFFIGLFWSVGIAGGDIVQSVMSPIWISLSANNLAAFEMGTALPHIVTQQFNSIYLWVGGAGSTLSLCFILVFMSKSQQCKKIGKLAFLPGLFNINEPIIFGLPIVLNPVMIIPFILTPLVLAVVTYFAMSTGIVPRPNGVFVPWTTPPIIGGFLVSGIRGALLQIVELLIAFSIYLPFVKAIDRKYYLEEQSYEEQPEVIPTV